MKQKKKILLIDDDEINNFIAEEWIKTSYPDQVELLTFLDAEKAIQYLDTCKGNNFPDLIMCDLKMPTLHGFEFIELYEEEFFQQYPNTKILILSSSIRKDDEDKAKSYQSVSGFIPKLSIQDNFQHIFNHHL